MSSTLRLFVNDNRISTAVNTKSGIFFQVYPAKKVFPTELAWRQHWEQVSKSKILLKVTPSSKKKLSLKDWKITEKETINFTLPPGDYYIGDLCYVLSDDVYNNIFGGMDYTSGIYEEKGSGHTFLIASTAWGDGYFIGSDGNHFAVDAGNISICSTALVEKNDGGGHIYSFDTPVACHFRAGRFSFLWGHNSLMIDTTGDDDVY